MVERAKNLSLGKTQIALIEASDQDAHYFAGDNPGVSADEFRGEVWEAILRGATAVVYYPYRLSQDANGTGFKYDNISQKFALRWLR